MGFPAPLLGLPTRSCSAWFPPELRPGGLHAGCQIYFLHFYFSFCLFLGCVVWSCLCQCFRSSGMGSSGRPVCLCHGKAGLHTEHPLPAPRFSYPTQFPGGHQPIRIQFWRAEDFDSSTNQPHLPTPSTHTHTHTPYPVPCRTIPPCHLESWNQSTPMS